MSGFELYVMFSPVIVLAMGLVGVWAVNKYG